MRKRIVLLLLVLLPGMALGQNQTYFQYKTDDARLVFFDKNLSRYIPHMVRMFRTARRSMNKSGLPIRSMSRNRPCFF